MPKLFKTKTKAVKEQTKLRKQGHFSRRTKVKNGYKITRTREVQVTKDPKGKKALTGRLQRLEKARKQKGRRKSQSKISQSFRFFG